MENIIKISKNTTIENKTVDELLTAQRIGEIATPDIQRPAGVWTEEQEELLADTLLRGWSVGVISLVEVGDVLLIVDGLQRLTALSHNVERREALVATLEAAVEQARAAAEGKADDSNEVQTLRAYEEELAAALDELDSLYDCLVCVSVTASNDLTDAAMLFVRLNNGTPLSKIQRGTAGLDGKVLEWARGWADLLPAKVGGKINRDEAALVMASCAADPAKMTTNGPSAIKSLAKLTAADLDRLPAVDRYRKAAEEYIAAMETAGNVHMLTAQYMIPYILGSGDAEHTLTRTDWAELLAKSGIIGAKRVRTMTPAKGKARSQDTTRRASDKDDNRLTWEAIDGNKSNAPKATIARYSAVALGDLYGRIKGVPCPGDWGYKTAAKQAAKADPAAAVADTVKALAEVMGK